MVVVQALSHKPRRLLPLETSHPTPAAELPRAGPNNPSQTRRYEVKTFEAIMFFLQNSFGSDNYAETSSVFVALGVTDALTFQLRLNRHS
jgi:hypothetical protein